MKRPDWDFVVNATFIAAFAALVAAMFVFARMAGVDKSLRSPLPFHEAIRTFPAYFVTVVVIFAFSAWLEKKKR